MQEITCVFLKNLRVLFLKYAMLTYKEMGMTKPYTQLHLTLSISTHLISTNYLTWKV